MKENKDKLDLLFEKAFQSFEEPPPPAIKTAIFKKLLFYNSWQQITNYIGGIMLLSLLVSIVYFYGASTSEKSSPLASNSQITALQNNDVNTNDNVNNTDVSNAEKVKTVPLSEKSIKETESTNIINPIFTETQEQLKAKDNSLAENNKDNTLHSSNYEVKKEPSISKEEAFKNKNSGKQNIVETTDFLFEKRIIDDSKITIPKMAPILSNNEIAVSAMENMIPLSSNNSNRINNYRAPLLWSAEFYLGHSIYQSNIIETSEQVSDDNYKINTSIHFPSGNIGFNVRGTQKHLFFDFGLQYANYSEKITTNQLLYNSQELQDISFLGQNTVVDTNGGYYHNFFVCDSTIRLFDSVWTWRIDTSLINLYDTSYVQGYDTLKDPSWINSYSLFEFPLNIGWMKNMGRVNIGVSTGPVFSLLVCSKGKMPYYTTDQAELIAVKNEFPAFSFGMSWQISGIINYQFSNRMLVEFSPYYRHTLIPIKSSQTSSVMKFNLLGLQLGLRYYF